MRVVFDEKNKVFLLHTQNTTYAIAVTEDKYVNHLYYGKKLEDTDIRYLLRGSVYSGGESKRKEFLSGFCSDGVSGKWNGRLQRKCDLCQKYVRLQSKRIDL